MLTIQTKGKVIEKATEDYNIDNNAITVNKVRVLIDDEIFDFRFKGDTMKIFNDIPAKGEIEFVVGVSSPREKFKVDLIQLIKAKVS